MKGRKTACLHEGSNFLIANNGLKKAGAPPFSFCNYLDGIITKHQFS